MTPPFLLDRYSHATLEPQLSREITERFHLREGARVHITSSTLTDLDHDGLFKAKTYYRNGQRDSPPSIQTEAINMALRDVISKEYQNMKGIEKYGRNHGLCPYTPYEDLPEASKRISRRGSYSS